MPNTSSADCAGRAARQRPGRPVNQLSVAERLNFLVTNRIPRRLLTLFIGWFSKIRNPLVKSVSIAVWKLFADDLRLHEARKQKFDSMHDCFTRQLADGARPLHADTSIGISPCDAVIGEFGQLDHYQAIQAKGFPYSIVDLLDDEHLAMQYRGGSFVTLRLKSSMYHRFHAPAAGQLQRIRYISGDTWNVNPVALKIVDQLFCKNERVVVPLDTGTNGPPLLLVAVAAVLVASVRLHGLKEPLNLRYRGTNLIEMNRTVARGEELGYFEHGSTIIVLAPDAYPLHDSLQSGHTIRMGQPLIHLPPSA